MEKIRHLCQPGCEVTEEDVKRVHSELERTFKMFYLRQQMRGKLKEHRDEYFV